MTATLIVLIMKGACLISLERSIRLSRDRTRKASRKLRAFRQYCSLETPRVMRFDARKSRNRRHARPRFLQVHDSAILVNRLLGGFERTYDPKTRATIAEWWPR